MFNATKKMIYEMAKSDPRVILISVDQDVGLGHMAQELPNQYMMEGISEANATGMASGLAADGYIPFIINHASFIVRRSFEQIALDACLQDRRIRFVGMGAGVATAHLGPTHTVIEDIAVMRALPNMTVVVPCDADEIIRFMPQTLTWPGPIYIRLARYGQPAFSKAENGFEIGKAILLKQALKADDSVLLVSTGATTGRAIAAAEQLAPHGIDCGVLHIHTIKPFDGDALVRHARGAKLIVTIEEHVITGGLGSACLEALSDGMPPGPGIRVPRVVRLALPDQFIHEYGTQESVMETYGLETHQIVASIKGCVDRMPPARRRAGVRSRSATQV